MEADMLASLKNKEKYSRYFGSLKYALYVITPAGWFLGLDA